jgi:hypothetical protein
MKRTVNFSIPIILRYYRGHEILYREAYLTVSL